MTKLILTAILALLIISCSTQATKTINQPVKMLPPSQLDTDKDGVNDEIDQCLNTPLNVIIDKNGCPQSFNPISNSSFEYRAHFDKNSTVIKPIYLNELQNVISNNLQAKDNITGGIIAGTSSDESDFTSEKMQLSKNRALQVKKQFIQLTGIDPKNIVAIGCGDYNPIAEENSEKGRELNRRIYMNFGSDFDNRHLVLDKFGKLKDEYKHCEIVD